jgi:hypothetical protein
MLGTMAGMPKKPVPSTDELARMLWQAEAEAGDILMQQMLDRLGQQTFVGGKRVTIQALPRLPKQAARQHARAYRSLGCRPSAPCRPTVTPEGVMPGTYTRGTLVAYGRFRAGDEMAGSRVPPRWHGRGRRGAARIRSLDLTIRGLAAAGAAR